MEKNNKTTNKTKSDSELLTQDSDIINKIQKRVSLVSKFGHELKNPIHAISGMSIFLSENWEKVEEQKKKLCMLQIQSGCDTLTDTVAKMLQIGGGEEEDLGCKKTNNNLVDLINDASKDFRGYINSPRNLEITILNEIEEDPYAMVDAFWFKRTISNLLTNSIKYSAKNNILIEVSDYEQSGLYYYLISVSDECGGITESELCNIFLEHNREETVFVKSKEGVGLGLFICKEVVRLHQGKIWAENNDKQGATVKFTIPKFNNLD
jgi:signal transduction histidine kinase